MVYSGSAQALLNSGSTSHGTIQYSSDNSTWGASIPSGTNATSYTSYWRLVGDSNHNNVNSTSISTTIAKVTPTVTAPTAKSLTYNGSAQALANAGSTNWGTLKYSLDNSTYSTSVPSGTNATSYTVYYKVDGDSNINNVAAKSIACSIAKANPTYTAPTAKSLTYTGSAQALLNAGSTSHGTIQYSSDNSTWSTSIPSGTNATSYTSYWKLVGDSNHNNVNSTSISTTIAKANGSVTTAPTAKSLTYNASAQALVNAGSGTGTMMYKLDSGSWGTSVPTATNATSYTVYYKASASTNYNESASGSVACSIAKVTPTVTAPTAKVLTFNNANQVLANAGSTNYGTIQYCLNNSGGTYSNTVPSASAANVTYKVWYKVVGDSNINNVAPASINCSIAEKRVTTPTITLDPSSYTYSGSACKPTPTVKDGSTVIPSSEYTTSYSNNTNAGTATVTISDIVAGNYYISGTTTFNIAKAGGNVSTKPTAKSLTFNNANQALVNAGSGTGTMMYFAGYDINIYTESDGSKWRRIAHQNNPTSYKFASNNTFSTGVYIDANRWFDVDYCNQLTSFELMIKQKATSSSTEEKYRWIQSYNPMTATFAQVAAANVTKITTAGYSTSSYGGLYPINSNTYLCANNGTQGNWWGAVGSWNAHQGGIPAWNGVIVTTGYVDLYVRVTDANISNSWSSTIPSEKNAGTYVVAYKASASTNYNESASGSVSCSIAKVTPTVTAPSAKSLTYNGSAQALVNAGSTNYGTLQYSLDNSTWGTSIPSGTNATSYTVYYRVVGNNNINDVASKNIACSIAKANQNAPTATGASVTYGNTATATASGGGGQGSIEWSNGNTLTGNVGSKTTKARWAGNSNYNASSWSNEVTLAITKVAMTYSAPKAAARTYNASAQQIVSGQSAGGGSIYYATSSAGASSSTTVPTQTNAGTYSTYWKAIPDGNHSGGTSTWAQITGCTINKANQNAPTATGASVTYGNTATATASGGGGQGSIEWSNGNTLTGNVGSKTTKARWAGNSNYNASSWSNEVTLAITKVAMTYSAPKAAARTYNASAQQIVSGQSAGGGSIYYATSSAGASSSTTVPTQTNAGTYSTYWKAIPDGNHSGGTSTWAQVTGCSIAKANQNAPTATGATVAFHNTATATASGGGGQGTLSWTNGNTRTATGSQDTYAYWAGNSNYNASPNSNKVTLTVNKATDQSVTVTLTNRTYNGSGQVVASATSHGCTYYLGFGSSSTSAPSSWGSANSSISQTNAGTYYVWYKGTADGNHSADIGATYKGTVTIGKANQNAPTATGATVAFHNTATATASGGGGQGTLTWTNGNTRTATGSQDTYAYWAGNSNYNASPNSNKVTLTVNKATDQSVTVTLTNRTYNGSGQVVASATSHGCTYYLGFGSSSTSAPSSWGSANSSISQTNAGTYYVWYKGTADGNHSADIGATYKGTVTIGKADQAAPTATGATTTYNTTATATASGGGGQGTLTWTNGNTQTSVGSKKTKAYWAGNSNYNASPQSNEVTLTMNKANGSVTINGVSLTYNTSSRNLATVSNNTGTMHYSTNGTSWSTSIPTATNVGSWTIYWYMDASTNYNGIASASTRYVSSSIGKANQNAPTATGATTTYNTTATATASGGGGQGSIEWSNGNTQTSVGSKTTKARWSGNSNYNASPYSNEVTLTMNKANGSVSTKPTNRGVTYNGGGQNLCNAGSGTGTMLYYGGSNSSWSTSIPQGTNAGSYTVYYKASASTNYNESASGSVSCTIAKAAGSVSTKPTAKSLEWTGSAQALVNAGSGTGTMLYYGGSNSSWSTSIPTGTNAGSYTIYYKASASTNYNESASGSVTSTISHAYVDLGLSVKWAKYNVGVASSSAIETSGLFFSWANGTGHVGGSYDFSASNYSSTPGGALTTENAPTNATYDGARNYWGGSWRLPTKAESEELMNNCTWEKVVINNVNCWKVYKPSDSSKYIIMPKVGCYSGTAITKVGDWVMNWTSTNETSDIESAYVGFWGINNRQVQGSARRFGFTIRPVC